MITSKTFSILAHIMQRPWLPPLAVLLAAFVLRLIFLMQFSSFPLFDVHIMDMEYFHRLATEGVPGTGFPDGPYFKAPLYPLFLKLIYSAFGTGPWAPRIIQILMGSLSALFTYLIAARMFSRRVAFIAGMMVALSGTLILFDGQLLIPTLAICLNLAAIYLLIAAMQSNRTTFYILSGLFFGLSAIARPTTLLIAGGVTIYLFWLHRRELRRMLSPPICFLLGLVLAISPVTVRNAIESHEFVLTGTYGGINLYIGNNLQSDGVSTTVPGTGLDWWHDGLMDETRHIANVDMNRELSASEQSTYWRNRALQVIVDNPMFFIENIGRKFLLFLDGYELANNFDIQYLSKRIGLLNYLILRKPVYWPWGILLPMGIAGIILVRQWRPERYSLLLFLVCSLPSFLLFFVTARYRLPLIPFLAIFGAVAIEAILRRFQGISMLRVGLAIATFLVLLMVGRLDPLGYASGTDAQGHQMMATLYDQKGDLSSAERYYRLALHADPTLPHSNNDLGLLLLNRGETSLAIEHLEQAVRYRPDEWLIQYNLGLAYMTAERWTDAIDQYQLALSINPEMHTVAKDLAFSWLRAGYPDSAIAQYRNLIDIQPDNYMFYFSAGLCFQILEQGDSALSYYHQSLALEQNYPQTHYNLGRYWIETNQADSAQFYLQSFLKLSHNLPELEAKAQLALDSIQQR